MRRVQLDAKGVSKESISQVDEYIEYLETSQWMMDTFAKGESAWKHFVERIDVLAARLKQMEWHLKDASSISLVLELAQWARLLALRLESLSREARNLVPWLFNEKYEASFYLKTLTLKM